jgi:hypothetical protein
MEEIDRRSLRPIRARSLTQLKQAGRRQIVAQIVAFNPPASVSLI